MHPLEQSTIDILKEQGFDFSIYLQPPTGVKFPRFEESAPGPEEEDEEEE